MHLFTENSASLAWHTSHASPSWVVLASACEAELLSLWHAEQAAVSGGELVMKSLGVATDSRFAGTGSSSEPFTWHWVQSGLHRAAINRERDELIDSSLILGRLQYRARIYQSSHK